MRSAVKMASNRFGSHFTLTTWGESHGKAIGAIVDGCPPGIAITEEEINKALFLRSPLRNTTGFSTPRKEPDQVQILSGVYQGVTTGAPISLIIYNQDARPQDYKAIKQVYRPGHANFTYEKKYGHFDPRGGGRASARETAARVAAGAIAAKILASKGIRTLAFLSGVGSVHLPEITVDEANFDTMEKKVLTSALFCPDPITENAFLNELEHAREKGDSVGSKVSCHVVGMPAGVGSPIYKKVEALLASAMLSINACKGFEIGSGFNACMMMGSDHNDPFTISEKGITCSSNHAGGVLAGITTGMPIYFSAAFKPPSSIQKQQYSVTRSGSTATLSYGAKARHDICLGIRAALVVKAMTELTLLDLLLS